jgi:hypothetical protein
MSDPNLQQDPDQKRLDELDERIRQTRAQAEDDLGIGEEQPFVESGAIRPDEDDQTIAPG